MQTKHLYVLLRIRTKGEVGTIIHCKPYSRKKDFTDHSKAVLLLWILLVIYVSCVSLLCCFVCSLQPCNHLLGKG